MEQEKIDRINALAHLAKERTLTDRELAEQRTLRREFLADIRQQLRAQLENIEIVDEAANSGDEEHGDQAR